MIQLVLPATASMVSAAGTDREFSVVDTGGWVVKSDDIFEDAIRKQVLVATEEADLVLFLVDVNTGLDRLG